MGVVGDICKTKVVIGLDMRVCGGGGKVQKGVISLYVLYVGAMVHTGRCAYNGIVLHVRARANTSVFSMCTRAFLCEGCACVCVCVWRGGDVGGIGRGGCVCMCVEMHECMHAVMYFNTRARARMHTRTLKPPPPLPHTHTHTHTRVRKQKKKNKNKKHKTTTHF